MIHCRQEQYKSTCLSQCGASPLLRDGLWVLLWSARMSHNHRGFEAACLCFSCFGRSSSLLCSGLCVLRWLAECRTIESVEHWKYLLAFLDRRGSFGLCSCSRDGWFLGRHVGRDQLLLVWGMCCRSSVERFVFAGRVEYFMQVSALVTGG